MSTFVKGGGTSTPFGRNEFLRSTQDVKVESFTLAGSTVPARTIDGVAGQKVIQPGTVMAKITGGPAADVGKIGPYNAQATDGRQTLANVVGILMTFLPWQTIERDVEVGVVYQATVVQAWCIELDLTSLPVPLTNTTAAGMVAGKRLNINFV